MTAAALRDSVLLFLHIPKCGGTTLTNCIYDSLHDRTYPHSDDRFFADGVFYHPAGLHKVVDEKSRASIPRNLHRPELRAVVGHFAFGIHEGLHGRAADYITMLRHPVARVASLYYHLRRYDESNLHRTINDGNIGIAEFVRSLACHEVDNDQTRRLAGRDPEFGACGRDLLDEALENLSTFRFAGITELFDASLLLLTKECGWARPPVYLPGLVNQARPATDSLASSDVEAILEFNQLDLELYNRARAALDSQIAAAGAEFAADLEAFRLAVAEHQGRRTKNPTRFHPSIACDRPKP